MRGIWITWEKQTRNHGISKSLSFKLYEIIYSKGRLVRYLLSSLSTLKIINKERPTVVVVQNPSIVLSIISILLKFFYCYKIVIDSHNSGIFPMEGKSKLLMLLSKFIQKKADLTIVTNEGLKKVVESNNGRAFILPDKIPTPGTIRKDFCINLNKENKQINIVCICCFGNDEPYNNIIESAKFLGSNIKIQFTGKYNGKVDIASIPNNVNLLGYISDVDYWSILASSDAIIDLTLRDNCLVCGAYEAIAVGKPLILSNTKALRSYFNQGCTFVNPADPLSIAEGIKNTVENLSLLKVDIFNLKNNLSETWNKKIKELYSVLQAL